jgi:hypothetical protein
MPVRQFGPACPSRRNQSRCPCAGPPRPPPSAPDSGTPDPAAPVTTKINLSAKRLCGSAFGLLATVQAGGNVAASAIAGLLYTLTTPEVAFFYVAAWMLIALAGLAFTATAGQPGRPPSRLHTP